MADPVRLVDPITDVTHAASDLLEPYFPQAKWGGAPPKVIALPLTPSLFGKIADATPRLYFGWEGLSERSSVGRIFAGDLTFRVLAVIKNNASERAHLGDRHSPGLYPTLIAIVAALHGRTIGDHGTIQVTEANQLTADGWSGYGAAAGFVTFKVHTSLGDFLGEGAAAEDFRALVSAFEVNPPADPDAEPSFAMESQTTLGDAP